MKRNFEFRPLRRAGPPRTSRTVGMAHPERGAFYTTDTDSSRTFSLLYFLREMIYYQGYDVGRNTHVVYRQSRI